MDAVPTSGSTTGAAPDGDADADLASGAREAGIRLTVALVGSNLAGAGIVFVFAVWILPRVQLDHDVDFDAIAARLAAAYLVVSLAVGAFVGQRIVSRPLRWTTEHRPPTHGESRALQRAPLRLAQLELALWSIALVLFTIFNGLIDPRLIPRALFTILLGGISTCAVTYLVAELELRNMVVAALALRGARPEHTPGITARAVTAWAIGSGVALLGVVITAIVAIVDDEQDTAKLASATALIAGLGLALGLLTTLLAARAIRGPVRSVERALARVDAGNLDVSVPVYDGSELGQLQSGFNTMAAGLRERERMRDLFARHVGEDVAREALQRGTAFAATRTDAAVLFVDLIGSTKMAETRPPDEVLGVLNRFFGLVVEVVDRHGGWVNKFEGDGALVVFGVPQPLMDPAGAALGAARELASILPVEAPDCDAGIGVAFGPVVAGNLGDARRFEFTVIGDVVNTAARLTDLAKVEPGRVLTTAATITATADAGERLAWEPLGPTTLRGRAEPIELARRIVGAPSISGERTAAPSVAPRPGSS